MDTVRRRALISGQVQGVGFRMNTLVQAERLGLGGFARNLSDGRVEVEIEGAPASVDALLGWLESGPRYATVATIEVEERAPTGATEFTVL